MFFASCSLGDQGINDDASSPTLGSFEQSLTKFHTISVDGPDVSGFLKKNFEHHAYPFAANSGSTVKLSAVKQGASNLAPVVYLLDPQEQVVDFASSSLTVSINKTGKHWLVVGAESSVGTGGYSAGVECVGGSCGGSSSPGGAVTACKNRFSSSADESAEMFAFSAFWSGKSDSGTSRAASISSCVRRRMKTGLPRNMTVICVPGSTPLMSTRLDDKARTSADGFIWATKGQTAAPAVTAPAPAVA